MEVEKVTALALLACVALTAGAQVPTKIYAQELVEQALARNPGLLVAVMHVTPPKTKDNVIIASNIGRLGKVADEDDLRVIETGKSNLEVNAAGNRFEVELALRDVVGDPIGALGLVFPYRAGDDKAAIERRAIRIRDDLARRILNVANLMDPFPLEGRATTKTHAQKLVDEAQARNADLLVLALRSPPRGSKDIVVLGSTFGRHGKKADADDLKVLEATEPRTGVFSNGKRFGIDLPLRDASGKTIGTMNVGYAYKEGDDRAVLVRKAEKLRGELERRIASADQLDELDP
jgi:iron complex outermembrane receptor protein